MWMQQCRSWSAGFRIYTVFKKGTDWSACMKIQAQLFHIEVISYRLNMVKFLTDQFK